MELIFASGKTLIPQKNILGNVPHVLKYYNKCNKQLLKNFHALDFNLTNKYIKTGRKYITVAFGTT